MRAVDNLELLLPQASAAQQDRARRLITLLRLIADEGRRERAASVRVTLDRARDEFDAHTRRRLRGALLDLARHGAYADAGDGFAWFGEPELGVQAAWSVLEEYREEFADLPSVPQPNEPASAVVARVLRALDGMWSHPAEAQLWSVRAERAAHGIERGEVRFRQLFEELRTGGDPLAPEALSGWAECMLDRGAVRVARQLLEEHANLVRGSSRAARLRCWTAMLVEDEASARALDAELPSWSARLPAALIELRERNSAWLSLLAGKPSGVAPALAPMRSDSSSMRSVRRACGAVLASVFALREAGRHELVECDASPGLREHVDDWLRALDSACPDSSTPEYGAILNADAVVVHRTPSQPLRSSIARHQVQALAVAPILDEQGEVSGWLRLEWEHHLVPPAARLRELALQWRSRVLQQRGECEDGARNALRPDDVDWTAPSGEGPCAEVLRALVGELAMKTAQRRWWGFEVLNGRARWVASGGAAGESRLSNGPRRAVRRALRSSGLVQFDEPNSQLAISREAASGLVLPLVARGELRGLLAIESTRRKDFPSALSSRWLERARAFAVDLRIAQFREWHRARFGHDVMIEWSSTSSSWVEPVLAAARSRACCAIVGPAGSGKETIARWLHFESGADQEPLLRVSAAESASAPFDEFRLAALQARAASGTVVLDELERLSPAAQAALLAHFEASSSNTKHAADQQRAATRPPRWLVLSDTPFGELVQRGLVRSDLARRLERWQLRLPALAERRRELPRIVSVLARRFAEEERVVPPTFDDGALALLWRQPWNGNVRELENFVFKVVLLHAGQEVHVGDLEALARRFQFELVRRISSRVPDPELLRAALATTANLRGSINKTRAALYLGWDPDTLVARLQECGLLERANELGAELGLDGAQDADASSNARTQLDPSATKEEGGSIAGIDPP